MRLDRATMHAYLAKVRCPVDVLRPSHGWPFPSPWRDWLRTAIPHVDIHDLDGGHHIHLESPGLVADWLRAGPLDGG